MLMRLPLEAGIVKYRCMKVVPRKSDEVALRPSREEDEGRFCLSFNMLIDSYDRSIVGKSSRLAAGREWAIGGKPICKQPVKKIPEAARRNRGAARLDC